MGIATADPLLNLTGKWTLEKFECLQYTGEFLNFTSPDDYWEITQNGNIIHGINYFTTGNTIFGEPIAGVISPDGTTAHVVDKSGGTYIVYINSDDTLTINYVNTGKKKDEDNYAFALYEVMKKSE